jgi:hypothetical protein
MGYCTITEIDSILAQSLTSATNPLSQQRRSLMQIGNVRDKNVIPDEIVEQYILWGGSEIDATLSELYETPFCEMADFESLLFSDITDYNNYVVIEKACPLTPGDTIVITNGVNEERHTIDEVVAPNVFSTIDPIQYEFQAGSRVLRVKFPDPIPWVCARVSAANIYDKYFAAQVSPAISDYGKLLRDQSRQKLNDILNGRAILHGVHRIGRRLYDSTIADQYGLPFGPNKGASKDIDKL